MQVELIFVGEPFNRSAVIHTLRHLAMRAGWQLIADGHNNHRRIVYATLEDPRALAVSSDDIVILSSPQVAAHLASSGEPIPIRRLANDKILPFPHCVQHTSWICADVIAGAYAAMNLWYEQKTRAEPSGWIRWPEDWMAKIGLREPLPLADQWLDEIASTAQHLGWGDFSSHSLFPTSRFTIVLTHDVDYVPGLHDRGLPRLARALARQILVRRHPQDALDVLANYVRAWPHQPYWEFERILLEEQRRDACSSFQIVATRRHPLDPGYAANRESLVRISKSIGITDWEICLHGSYTASRTPDQLKHERSVLERIIARPVQGHRQHYLNFAPAQLFHEVERAGFQYDLSVGYNDRSGPRAGTYFPYHPFDPILDRPCDFWEVPFVLMDTTLATTLRLSSCQAYEHAQRVLESVALARGCVSMIWHQEQLGGLLDAGFGRVYYDLLNWIKQQGGKLVAGGQVMRDLGALWSGTVARS